MRETMKGKTASELSINNQFINEAKKYEKIFKDKKDKEEYSRLITSKNGNDFSKGMLMVDKYMDDNGMKNFSPLEKNNQGANLSRGNEKWFNSINSVKPSGDNNKKDNATNDASSSSKIEKVKEASKKTSTETKTSTDSSGGTTTETTTETSSD
ncbi:MAG: hypothetical protein Q9M97_02840 [Candidatus Gracilibacteria bacterium]|nr:hypothetical protein [Candidatus Gracilibacteria bacterium]